MYISTPSPRDRMGAGASLRRRAVVGRLNTMLIHRLKRRKEDSGRRYLYICDCA